MQLVGRAVRLHPRAVHRRRGASRAAWGRSSPWCCCWRRLRHPRPLRRRHGRCGRADRAWRSCRSSCSCCWWWGGWRSAASAVSWSPGGSADGPLQSVDRRREPRLRLDPSVPDPYVPREESHGTLSPGEGFERTASNGRLLSGRISQTPPVPRAAARVLLRARHHRGRRRHRAHPDPPRNALREGRGRPVDQRSAEKVRRLTGLSAWSDPTKLH